MPEQVDWPVSKQLGTIGGDSNPPRMHEWFGNQGMKAASHIMLVGYLNSFIRIPMCLEAINTK